VVQNIGVRNSCRFEIVRMENTHEHPNRCASCEITGICKGIRKHKRSYDEAQEWLSLYMRKWGEVGEMIGKKKDQGACK